MGKKWFYDIFLLPIYVFIYLFIGMGVAPKNPLKKFDKTNKINQMNHQNDAKKMTSSTKFLFQVMKLLNSFINSY